MSIQRISRLTFVLAAAMAAALTATARAQTTVLFADNFNRADNRDIDGDLTGVTNSTGTVFAPSAVYTSPWVDPATTATATPAFGVPDAVAGNGGGQQILANQLQLKYNVGTANLFVNHNFTNAAILAAGGFRVSLDVNGYNQATTGQGAAIAIGMTQAEALAAKDAFEGSPDLPPATKMTNVFQTPAGTAAVQSDFWIGLRGNGTLAWGAGAAAPTVATVAAKTGTISATFSVSSFNAGSNVSYEVFYNGISQGVGSFAWSTTNANYIGLDGRDNMFVNVDNFLVETTLPPPKPTLIVNRDTGNITLRNLTSSPQNITVYSIVTTNGEFNQANWNTIEAQNLDTNDDWIKLTNAASTTDLSEGTFGALTLNPNGSVLDRINFGNAWRRSPFEDVTLELRDTNGNEIPVVVQYEGHGGVPFDLGDFNLNGDLDQADWTTLRASLTTTTSLTGLEAYFAGDLNRDGLINRLDFRQFKNLYNAANGANAFEAMTGVPEPTGLALVAMVGASLVARRRRVRRISSQLAAPALAILVAAAATNATAQTTLFQDTFDRADSLDIDASTTGITNNTGTAFAASAVYTSPWVDPATTATAVPPFGPPDAVAGNGGGQQVLGNQLQLKYGVGTANLFVNHNFTNSSILTAGGFSVSVDVTGYNEATAGQGTAIAIGMQQAAALQTADAFSGGGPANTKFTNAFGGTTGTAISSFWVGLRGNATLAWGTGNTTLGTSPALAAKTGTLSAKFAVGSFTAGSPVAYEVFYNGASQGAGAFLWNGASANYIGLDGRDNTNMNVDNFRVATATDAAIAPLRLRIDTNSGAASLVGGTAAATIDFLEIRSAAGGLTTGGYTGLSGAAGFPHGNGSGNGWEKGATSTASITETYLQASSAIAANAPAVSLGTLYNTGLNTRDIQFSYEGPTGVSQIGFVEYVTSTVAHPDFDGNGRVDGGDFLIWQRNLGTNKTFAQGDANGDTVVNGADLAIWRSKYNQPPATAATAAVPEPASLGLAACGAVAAGLTRRRGRSANPVTSRSAETSARKSRTHAGPLG